MYIVRTQDFGLFWPTHPPLYAFHMLRLDPSLLYVRNWLTHPPFTDNKSDVLPLCTFLRETHFMSSVALLFYTSNMVFKAIISVGAWTLGGAKIQKAKKPLGSSLWTYATDRPIHPSCTLGYAPWVPTHPSPMRTYYVHSPFQILLHQSFKDSSCS